MIADTKMTKADLQFKIDQLRQEKIIYSVEALVVLVLAVVTAIFLPEVLFRTVLSANQSPEIMSALNWIPTGAYIVGALFAVYALVRNFVVCHVSIKRLEAMLDEAKR